MIFCHIAGILPGLLSLRFCEIQTIKCEKKITAFAQNAKIKRPQVLINYIPKKWANKLLLSRNSENHFAKLYSRWPFFSISDGFLWNYLGLQRPIIFHVILRNRQKSVNTLAGWLRTIDDSRTFAFTRWFWAIIELTIYMPMFQLNG